MCRSDVAPNARIALAGILDEIRAALAAEYDADPQLVRVGPVDFGAEHDGAGWGAGRG